MATKRTRVETSDAPEAIGPYSQAIVAVPFVLTSGQIPIDPGTASIVQGGIREQTKQVLENLSAVLAASGSSLSGVVRTTCFLKDLGDFAEFNSVYSEYFPTSPPARSTVQVARLPMDVLVEIDCIALVTDSR
ncbi:RidA family protein [soil metagenome]